jgi:type IV fimbrial biogenesis protein FimT
MLSAPRRTFGFTLIELMVTLTVILVLTLLALPSFRTFQQRSALRGAADQAQSFWNQARFEAAKRNQMVKVGIETGAGGFCLGAATTTDAADDTPCQCLTGTNCDVAVWPKDQAAWRDVTLNGTPTLGTTNPVAVIEPKRATLATPGQAGVIGFLAPSGPRDYRLNLRIDELGRALLCESSAAPSHMSDYNNQSCSP